MAQTEAGIQFLAPHIAHYCESGQVAEALAQWLGGLRGQALLRRWHDFTDEIARRYAGVETGKRVVWGKVRMSYAPVSAHGSWKRARTVKRCATV